MRISCWDTTWSGDQRVAPPTSMYSMKRTSASCVRANSIRSPSSSSLTPRITTAFSLIFPSPAWRAATIPAITSAWRALFANARIRSGRKVSRLTVTRCRPAARRAAAWVASSSPLVVIARSVIRASRAISATRVGRSWRSNGSPPVSRTFVTPSPANTGTSRAISSNVRIDARGNHTYSSSGMQYRHRMLQRSVTETRRLASGRRRASRTTSDMRRLGGGVAGGVDPDGAAVRAQLLFPDRDAALDFLDHEATRLKRGGAVRRRGHNGDARLPGRDAAEAVARGEARPRPTARRGGEEPAELRVDHGLVRRILDRRHARLARRAGLVAHCAEEHAGPPVLGPRHLGEQRLEGDGGVRPMGHAVRPPPPAPPAIRGGSPPSSPPPPPAPRCPRLRFTPPTRRPRSAPAPRGPRRPPPRT